MLNALDSKQNYVCENLRERVDHIECRYYTRLYNSSWVPDYFVTLDAGAARFFNFRAQLASARTMQCVGNTLAGAGSGNLHAPPWQFSDPEFSAARVHTGAFSPTR